MGNPSQADMSANELIPVPPQELTFLRDFNPFLAGITSLPENIGACFDLMFQEGRLGGAFVEDVRDVKDNCESFIPRLSLLEAAIEVNQCARESYRFRNPASLEYLSFINRQVAAIRRKKTAPIANAYGRGRCCIIAGPPGIGHAAFRRAALGSLGPKFHDYKNVSAAVDFIRQLVSVEVPFCGNVDEQIHMMLAAIDHGVSGEMWEPAQATASRRSLLEPRLYSSATKVGLGLVYVYGVDADSLLAKSAVDCLRFLDRFADFTGISVVCSSTYAIWGLLEGTNSSVLNLAGTGPFRLDYISLGPEWRDFVDAFLIRHELEIEDREVDIDSLKSIPPYLARDCDAFESDDPRPEPTWFEVRLMEEALGLPRWLFIFLGILWSVMKTKKRSMHVIEKSDMDRASARYRERWNTFRRNVTVLLHKNVCTDVETARYGDWIVPERRAPL